MIDAVEDVNYIAQNEGLLKQMKVMNVYRIRRQKLLDVLILAMMSLSVSKFKSCSSMSWFGALNNFVLGICSTVLLNSAANWVIWKKDCRMALYHNSVNTAEVASSNASNETLRTLS